MRIWPTGTGAISSKVCEELRGKIEESHLKDLKVEVNVDDEEYKDTEIAKSLKDCYD
jgi:hypothetical protein